MHEGHHSPINRDPGGPLKGLRLPKRHAKCNARDEVAQRGGPPNTNEVAPPGTVGTTGRRSTASRQRKLHNQRPFQKRWWRTLPKSAHTSTRRLEQSCVLSSSAGSAPKIKERRASTCVRSCGPKWAPNVFHSSWPPKAIDGVRPTGGAPFSNGVAETSSYNMHRQGNLMCGHVPTHVRLALSKKDS